MKKPLSISQRVGKVAKFCSKLFPDSVSFAFIYWSTGKPVGPGWTGRADVLDTIAALRRTADDLEENYNTAIKEAKK